MQCLLGGVPDSYNLYPFNQKHHVGLIVKTSTCQVTSLNRVPSDLSEPVDVYSDWIDACEAANQ